MICSSRRSRAAGRQHGVETVVERGFEVDVGEAVPSQPLLVHTGPRCATVVDDPLPQKHFESR